MDIREIRYTNERSGFHFFDAATLRFFRSRIGSTVYEGPGGIYFVTSEQFVGSNGVAAPRSFTVRKFNPETSDVGTAGRFNELSRAAANRIAKLLAEGDRP